MPYTRNGSLKIKILSSKSIASERSLMDWQLHSNDLFFSIYETNKYFNLLKVMNLTK